MLKGDRGHHLLDVVRCPSSPSLRQNLLIFRVLIYKKTTDECNVAKPSRLEAAKVLEHPESLRHLTYFLRKQCRDSEKLTKSQLLVLNLK